MIHRASALCHVALLASGALAVHWLRYLVGYGAGADEALRAQGHAYLSSATLVVAGLAVASAAALCMALGRARHGHRAPAPPSFRRAWLGAALALSAIYSVQEVLEGQLAAGHGTGLHGVVGHGGWAGFAFAVGIAAVIALVRVGTAGAIVRAGRRRERAARPGASRPVHRPRPVDVAPLDAVAGYLAGRGPPLLAG